MLSRVQSFAVALLLFTQSSLACRCAAPTNVITTEFMQQADAVARVYVNYALATPASSDPDAYLYYLVTAHKWFKGDIGKGKLMLRTPASSATCSASVAVKSFSVLFGTVSYEPVPGYAGTVPTITIHSCMPQKTTPTITKAEWNTLGNYKDHVVCKATDCDGLTKPPLDPITCPKGTEYKQTEVCKGQDNGSCGWSLGGTCEASSIPVVCEPSDCEDSDKPQIDPVQCPSGYQFVETSACVLQPSAGTCGWTVAGQCKKD